MSQRRASADRRRLAACVLALVASAGCGAGTELDDFRGSDVTVTVGRLDGTDAVVATLRDEEGVVVYVCGGATTFDRWTSWYHGAATDRDLTANASSVSIDDGGLSGTFTASDGGVHAWSADSATTDSIVGLYTVVDSGCRTGVVVNADGSTQGVWCGGGDLFAQVTPVLPIERHAFVVQVTAPEGTRELTVERALFSSSLK